MSGLAELRNDLRNEVRYGLRYLVRDSAVGERRVRSLLTNERLPADELRAITDQLIVRHADGRDPADPALSDP